MLEHNPLSLETQARIFPPSATSGFAVFLCTSHRAGRVLVCFL